MDHANRHPRFILVLAILSAMMSGSSGTLYAQRTTAFEGGPVTMCLDSVRPNRLISCGGGILAKRKFTDATFFKEYAGDLTIGNTIAFNFGEQTSVYSELVGAYMHLGRLGYARAGFGALVAA
ncbi:MAG TPA: hypothetical protein VE913_06120, partial [Longimicrobium sp.]|nr:hypothetical protein [Longimicrobium sp.]